MAATRSVWQIVCVLLKKPEREKELTNVSQDEWLQFLQDFRSGEISTEGIPEFEANGYLYEHIINFVSTKLKQKQSSLAWGVSCNMIYY